MGNLLNMNQRVLIASKTIGLVAVLILTAHQSVCANDPEFNVFIGLDAGRIEKGKDMELKNQQRDVEGYTLVRNYFNLSFTQQLDEKNLISLGVGGLFFKPYLKSGEAIGDKTLKFGPGISHAKMVYSFNENMDLTYGYFDYKYNPGAKNLGEYLFRTEAYPTIVFTGGWVWLNSASYTSTGAKYSFNIGEGFFQSDFLLFMEMFNSPIYDITPAYVGSLNPTSFLRFGAGVSLHRFIVPTFGVREELTKPKVYVKDVPITPTEDHPSPVFTGLVSDLQNIDPIKYADSASYVTQTVTLNNRAIKLMAYFNLDFRDLIGLDRESFPEFMLYGETSLIGTKNYPIFYTKYSQRLVSMIGLSIPVPVIFDHLSFELEYLKNPNIESIKSTYDILDLSPDMDYRYQNITKDDVKWTLHGSRKLGSITSLYFQVANDHFRPKNDFAQPMSIPITNELSHWYWLVRFQWAL